MLSDARRTHITAIAWGLWNDFAEFRGEDFKSRLLLTIERPPRRTAVDFFRFCAQVCTQEGDAPLASACVVNYDLAEAKRTAPNRPASWLVMAYDARNIVFPAMVMDYGRINACIGVNQAAYMMNRLLLHEAGHLVLHWDLLRPQVGGPPLALAKSASPIHEAEAWWFCLSVFGRVVAEAAEESASDPKNADDGLWMERHW